MLLLPTQAATEEKTNTSNDRRHTMYERKRERHLLVCACVYMTPSKCLSLYYYDNDRPRPQLQCNSIHFSLPLPPPSKWFDHSFFKQTGCKHHCEHKRRRERQENLEWEGVIGPLAIEAIHCSFKTSLRQISCWM